jgi:hypothetical protein
MRPQPINSYVMRVRCRILGVERGHVVLAWSYVRCRFGDEHPLRRGRVVTVVVSKAVAPTELDSEDAADYTEHGLSPPGTPASATIRDALEALLSDAETMGSLHAIAESHAREPRDSASARELVLEAIADVLLGTISCDPSRSLAVQLAREVRRRTNQKRRADRSRHDPRVALVPLELASVGPFADGIDEAIDGSSEHWSLDAADVVAKLREHARDDGSVLQLIALYERGLVSRRQVLGAGMTEWAYRTARERLTAYATLALSDAATTPASAQASNMHDVPDPATPNVGERGTTRTHRAVARTRGRKRKSISA